MVLDEEGKLNLYVYGERDPIVGDVVVGTRDEMSEGDEEEEG